MQSTKTRRAIVYFRPAVNGIVIAIVGFGIFFLFRALENRYYEHIQKKRSAEIQEMSKHVRFEVRRTMRTEPLNATLVLDTSMVPRSSQGWTRTLVALDTAGRVVDSFDRPMAFSPYNGMDRAKNIQPRIALSITKLRVAVGAKITDFPLGKSKPPMLETSGSKVCVNIAVRNTNSEGIRKFTSRIDLLDSTGRVFRSDYGVYPIDVGMGPRDSLMRTYCQDFYDDEAKTVRGFAFVPQNVQPINPNFPNE